MTLIDNDVFLAWAGQNGLHLDRKYGPPQILTYANNHKFYLPVGNAVQNTSYTAAAFFGEIRPGAWQVWKRGGLWVADADPLGHLVISDGLMFLWRALGITPGPGALRFEKDERDALIALVMLTSMVAWRMTDDIFAVPETRDIVLYFDSDEALFIECANQGVFDEVEEALKSRAIPYKRTRC